jgi:protein-S-isoprenylcysteine O-methyltransferase Ste14
MPVHGSARSLRPPHRREEFRSEVAQAKAGGIALGTGAGLAVSSVSLFLTAIALAHGKPWVTAAVEGIVVLCLGSALAFWGWKALPRRPLEQTKARALADVKQFKERIA